MHTKYYMDDTKETWGMMETAASSVILNFTEKKNLLLQSKKIIVPSKLISFRARNE